MPTLFQWNVQLSRMGVLSGGPFTLFWVCYILLALYWMFFLYVCKFISLHQYEIAYQYNTYKMYLLSFFGQACDLRGDFRWRHQVRTCISEPPKLNYFDQLSSSNFGTVSHFLIYWCMASLRRRRQRKQADYSETSSDSRQANITNASMANRQEARDSVLTAIQESKEDLLKHIDKKTADIQTSLTKIETSLSTLSEQVQELETCMGANEDNINKYCSCTEKL